MLSLIIRFISPLTNLITPYINYIQIGAFFAAILGLGILYYVWRESVRAEAILQYKTKILEQTIKDYENQNKLLEKQIEITNTLVLEKNKKLTELKDTLDNLEKTVQEQNPSDEEAAKILKDTLESISKTRK